MNFHIILVIPLIHFVSDKNKMGEFAIGIKIKIFAWIIAAILVYLNSHLVIDFVGDFFQNSNSMILKIGLVVLVLLFLGLLLFITFYPLTLKNKPQSDADFHGMPIELDWSDDLPVHRIAIAVDFSVTDAKLIKKAVQQAHPSGFEHTPHQDTQFIFIHVVESVTANYLQDASDDAETRKDQERLDTYANALISKGYQVKTCLGYKNRVKEIVRIVNECDAQLLVMGGHRHQGWKDYIFGETIESVRHKVDIPVLIVNH